VRFAPLFFRFPAHKIYEAGPKGVERYLSVLGTPLDPIAFGGHHERDRRPGTENRSGDCRLRAKAAQLALQRQVSDAARIGALRDRFEERELLARIPDLPGEWWPRASRLQYHQSGVSLLPKGESLVYCPRLARASPAPPARLVPRERFEPSHVLLAIGLSREDARSSLRFSFGRATTDAEIDYALDVIPAVVARLRRLSPIYSDAMGRSPKVGAQNDRGKRRRALIR